jgi:hypothetical protein
MACSQAEQSMPVQAGYDRTSAKSGAIGHPDRTQMGGWVARL